MPLPLLIIAGAAGAVSLGMTAHSTLKQRKWKKIYEQAHADFEAAQKETQAVHKDFTRNTESLGRERVRVTATISDAAQYLQAVAKEYQLESLPDIPNDELGEWATLDSDIAKTVTAGLAGSAISGVAAASVPTLYTAAGLLGVASTGTRIAGLSGAAANSARLAWLGGGAIATGGGGVALGSTVLAVANAANIVAAPIALGAGIWGEKKAHDFEKMVTAKLKQFSNAEILMKRKATAMQVSIPRIKELFTTTQEMNQALVEELKKGRALTDQKDLPTTVPAGSTEPDLQIPFQVYHTAKALRELIEEPALSPDIKAVIES